MTFATLNSEAAMQWVTAVYKATVYANWLDDQLNADMQQVDKFGKIEGTVHEELFEEINEEVELVDIKQKLKPQTQEHSTLQMKIPSSPTKLKASQNESPVKQLTNFGGFIGNLYKSPSDLKYASDDTAVDSNAKFSWFTIINEIGRGHFAKVFKVQLESELAVRIICVGLQER